MKAVYQNQFEELNWIRLRSLKINYNSNVKKYVVECLKYTNRWITNKNSLIIESVGFLSFKFLIWPIKNSRFMTFQRNFK